MSTNIIDSDQRAVTMYALKNLVEMLKDPNSADRDADPAEADRQIAVAEQLVGSIQKTMDALGERCYQRELLIEGNGEQRYNETCNKQDWNEESQIIHLEGFIRDKGLFEGFAAYAAKAAEEENVETEHAERQPG